VSESPSQGSVSQWIAGLKAGDAVAAQELWDRYYPEVCRLARQMLGSTPRSVSDEEDAGTSVLKDIVLGAAAGRFQKLTNRDELWWLLVTITKQKAVSQMRRAGRKKRGEGRVRNETDIGAPGDEALFRLQDLMDSTPTPDFLVSMDEEHSRLMGLLRDDVLRRVAGLRLQGYSNEEISQELQISPRSVIRKFNLIRDRWASELDGSLEA
jgi:DNA-directed RNA polymerase specialized sigma24 family protein